MPPRIHIVNPTFFQVYVDVDSHRCSLSKSKIKFANATVSVRLSQYTQRFASTSLQTTRYPSDLLSAKYIKQMENLPRKRIRGRLTTNDSEKRDEDSPEFAESLTYDVLRIIFKYLNAIDLSNVSMVCRSWLEAANNEKRIRGPVCLMEDFEDLSENSRCNIECVKRKIIKNLSIRPLLGLFFTVPNSCNLPSDTVSQEVMLERSEKCHCKTLPWDYDTITLGTLGVVLNEQQIEDNVRNIACAFLPRIPRTTVKTFIFEKKSSVQRYSDELRGFFRDFPNNDATASRSLLLFCNDTAHCMAIKIVDSIKRSYPGKALSVWGGVARELSVCSVRNGKRNFCGKFALCVAVALIGDVQTWSVIIDSRCRRKDQVETKLRSFKDHVQLRKHSVGLMFSCCARGESMFDEFNVESSIFKKLFSDVPLVGCFGDGEFGENTTPNESSNKKTGWYNVLSTVFMILSYD